jgi:flagellar basal-body rod protein FlgB
MSGFPDKITNLLGRALALRLDRMHLLASNITNADTPGYLPVDMRFQEVLGRELDARELARTSEGHLPTVDSAKEAALFYDPAGMPGLDGNAVSLDREVAKLAENTVQYNATSQALQKKLAMLRYAVNDGGIP